MNSWRLGEQAFGGFWAREFAEKFPCGGWVFPWRFSGLRTLLFWGLNFSSLGPAQGFYGLLQCKDLEWRFVQSWAGISHLFPEKFCRGISSSLREELELFLQQRYWLDTKPISWEFRTIFSIPGQLELTQKVSGFCWLGCEGPSL